MRHRLIRVGVYGAIAVGALMVMVNPYLQQLAFGPAIQGIPLCQWQEAVRHDADPNAGNDSLAGMAVQWLGFGSSGNGIGWPDRSRDEKMLLLSLADDPRAPVRALVARRLGWHFDDAACRDALLK